MCTITLDGIAIDVVQAYRSAGFEVLPPELTMSARDMKAFTDCPANRSVHRLWDLKDLSENEACVVLDGDEFISIPPASF